jgi:hypothetical protein
MYNGPRISGGRRSELTRAGVCPLHPVDGRRNAPDSNWMAILGLMARREASAPSVLLALLQFLSGSIYNAVNVMRWGKGGNSKYVLI